MEIEKEVRYLIDEEQIKKIINNTKEYIVPKNMLDITFGYDGFDSYSNRGYICRIRQSENKKTMEVKNYSNSNECIEQHINLVDIKDGINYLELIGMEPYLYLKRNREVRKYKNLKIFIDKFDILGNYVEIEYQDSIDANNELNEFIKLIDINSKPQDMYGAIVKERLASDESFKELFNKELDKILNQV